MPKIIIADTSCFIILTNIGELELLKVLYGNVLTTPEVVSEYGEVLPPWVEVKTVSNKLGQRVLELDVDKGEASAITLAIETPESILILDDYKARKVAEKLGLIITGTLGIIVKAKLQGKISSIIPLLDKMKKSDFRLSEEIRQQALKEAGE